MNNWVDMLLSWIIGSSACAVQNCGSEEGQVAPPSRQDNKYETISHGGGIVDISITLKGLKDAE